MLEEKQRLQVDDAVFRGDGYGVSSISGAELRENASRFRNTATSAGIFETSSKAFTVPPWVGTRLRL